MSRFAAKQRLGPSLLDRLTDPEAQGTQAQPGYSVSQMTNSVLRDLECLMNTRQSLAGVPEGYVEVWNSILAYGVPDLTSLNALTPQQQREIGQVLEGVISRFEPRLRGVRATLAPSEDDKGRAVHFRMDARLAINPAPEVPFEAVLDLSTGTYEIKPGG